MKRDRGFTLVELMVCCGVIIILAAVMLPAIVSSIQTANETSTANVMRQVAQAEISYSQLYPKLGYTQNAQQLGDGKGAGAAACPSTPDNSGAGLWSCLLPASQAAVLGGTGTMAGYQFLYACTQQDPNTAGRCDAFTLNAWPTSSLSGRKAYVVDNSGVIGYQLLAPGQGGTQVLITLPCTSPCAVLGQ